MEDKKTRQNNWLRLVWGLWYVREGLKTFIEVKSKDQHQHFANKVQQQCTNGQPVNCNQCIVNQNLLPASQAQSSSSKVQNTGNQRRRLCPSHSACSELYDLIVDNHSIPNPRIHWKNTDSTKWWDQAVGPWEVTKCYFSSAGYDNKKGPADVDASGLLSLCIFSTYIQRHIAQIQNFEKVRDFRNTTLHAANYEVDTQTANDCLDYMIAVLSDTKVLHMDKDAQMACASIRKLKSGSLQMPTDVLEHVNAFAEMQKNADDAIRILQKKMSEHVNQAKDEINVVMGAAVKTLKTTSKEGVDLIKEKQSDAVNSVSVARIDAVNDVAAKQKEAIDNIVNSAMTQESERERIEEEKYLQKEKELREDLANFYEENHGTLPLHPILEYKDSKLLDFYQMPTMNIKYHLDENATRTIDSSDKGSSDRRIIYRRLPGKGDWRPDTNVNDNLNIKHHPDENATSTKDSSDKGLERDRIVNGNLCSFEDMFTQPQGKKGKCEVRNVYISADAGMGKSSFCKYLVLVWSALYFSVDQMKKVSDNLHSRNTFKDVDYLKRFTFVFLLTLRDFQGVEYKYENMILKQILENLNSSFHYDRTFLLKILSRNKCLIILDGLDEWFYSNIPFPKGGNRPLCTFLYTSRPWKFTYSNLSQSAQRNMIEMVGIQKAHVSTLVKNVTDCFKRNGVKTGNVDAFLTSLYSGKVEAVFVSAKSNDILAIPIVILQLLCLWHDGASFGKTITETYCKMVDMLFHRSMRKQVHQHASFDLPLKDPVSLPIFFKYASANSCIENERYMLQLSELAFVTLYSANKQNTLCFDNSVKCNLLSNEDYIKFAFNTGIVTCTKTSDTTNTEKRVYSFIHKSYQEMFCAVHITTRKSEEEFEQIVKRIGEHFHSKHDLLNLSNVFKFVCGMCGRSAQLFAKCIWTLSSDFHSNNTRQIPDRDTKFSEQIATMICKGYEEGIRSQQAMPPMPIQHVVVETSTMEYTWTSQEVKNSIWPSFIHCKVCAQDKATVNIDWEYITSVHVEGDCVLQYETLPLCKHLKVLCLINVTCRGGIDLQWISLDSLWLEAVTTDYISLGNVSDVHIEFVVIEGRQLSPRILLNEEGTVNKMVLKYTHNYDWMHSHSESSVECHRYTFKANNIPTVIAFDIEDGLSITSFEGAIATLLSLPHPVSLDICGITLAEAKNTCDVQHCRKDDNINDLKQMVQFVQTSATNPKEKNITFRYDHKLTSFSVERILVMLLSSPHPVTFALEQDDIENDNNTNDLQQMLELIQSNVTAPQTKHIRYGYDIKLNSTLFERILAMLLSTPHPVTLSLEGALTSGDKTSNDVQQMVKLIQSSVTAPQMKTIQFGRHLSWTSFERILVMLLSSPHPFILSLLHGFTSGDKTSNDLQQMVKLIQSSVTAPQKKYIEVCRNQSWTSLKRILVMLLSSPHPVTLRLMGDLTSGDKTSNDLQQIGELIQSITTAPQKKQITLSLHMLNRTALERILVVIISSPHPVTVELTNTFESRNNTEIERWDSANTEIESKDSTNDLQQMVELMQSIATAAQKKHIVLGNSSVLQGKTSYTSLERILVIMLSTHHSVQLTLHDFTIENDNTTDDLQQLRELTPTNTLTTQANKNIGPRNAAEIPDDTESQKATGENNGGHTFLKETFKHTIKKDVPKSDLVVTLCIINVSIQNESFERLLETLYISERNFKLNMMNTPTFFKPLFGFYSDFESDDDDVDNSSADVKCGDINCSKSQTVEKNDTPIDKTNPFFIQKLTLLSNIGISDEKISVNKDIYKMFDAFNISDYIRLESMMESVKQDARFDVNGPNKIRVKIKEKNGKTLQNVDMVRFAITRKT